MFWDVSTEHQCDCETMFWDVSTEHQCDCETMFWDVSTEHQCDCETMFWDVSTEHQMWYTVKLFCSWPHNYLQKSIGLSVKFYLQI